MKIKNDLISIKMGKKQYDFKNLIMDSYLERIIKRQLDPNKYMTNYADMALRYCLLKFDEPLEFDADSDIRNINFNIAITTVAKHTQDISPSQISIKTVYDINHSYLYDYFERTSDVKISDYYNRKITAIGFNSWIGNDTGWANPWPVCAILDTSNYNLYLQDNQDFVITRKDTITTDGIFNSKFPEIKAPLHLVPWGDKINNEEHYGVLYSVGFGYSSDRMYDEKIVGTDVIAMQDGNELSIGYITNNNETIPLVYPKNNLFPYNKLYPIKENYTYIFLKYKVYKIEDNVPTDTEMYYYQALKLDQYGTGEIKIKYERG